MKKVCSCISFLLLLLLFSGCESDGSLNEKSEIIVVGLGNKAYKLSSVTEVLFTGDDIQWFNRNTREIRFRDGCSFEAVLSRYEKILVMLADMELFSASIVSGIVETAYEDMVFYRDPDTDKYYLHESYPNGVGTEIVRLNSSIREENWGLFLYQLGIEGRLK